MTSPTVNATVRIKKDGSQGAPVKAGDCGTVVAVHEPTEDMPMVLVTRVKGDTWYFTVEDVDILDGDALFEEITGTLLHETVEHGEYDLGLQVSGTYFVYSNEAIDLQEPVQPELPFEPEGEDEDEEEGGLALLNRVAVEAEEESEVGTLTPLQQPGHEECPDGPHFHGDDGVHALPFLALSDESEDIFEAIDFREPDIGPDLVLRVTYPKHGRRMEAHLSEAQALALVTFLIRTYGPPQQKE